MAQAMNTGRGNPGEDHHKAVLSSGEVELLRSMYEEGMWSYRALAERFEVSKAHVRDIVKMRRRAFG